MTAQQRHRTEIARELAARGITAYDLIQELLEDRRTLVEYNAWLEQENTRLRQAQRVELKESYFRQAVANCERAIAARNQATLFDLTGVG